MIYPIFIFKTVEGFDGYFPDIDGCFFAGNTFADISKNAEEAFAVHIEALMNEVSHCLAHPKIRTAILTIRV